MKILFVLMLSLALTQSVVAQEKPNRILFAGCNVFDGAADGLAKDRNVLVEDNLIKAIGDQDLAAEGAQIIDCDGRTLLPGMHDQHVHLLVYNPLSDGLRQNIVRTTGVALVNPAMFRLRQIR